MIDRRSLNRMSIDTKIIHARLEAWAKWSKENQGDWPSRTLLGRMADGELPSTASRPPISMPDAIAITDKAVGRLRTDEQGVIRAYYQHWEPIDITARKLHMTVEKLKTILERARIRLDGYIKACEERDECQIS